MAADALLFDLDGTICDTRPWYLRLVASCGGDQSLAKVLLSDGRNIKSVIAQLCIPDSRFVEAGTLRVAELKLYAEVEPTFDQIVKGGTPTALVTGLFPSLANVILDGLNIRRYFSSVVTPWWRMQPKPHPASLQRALDDLGLEAARTIYYVGDLESDAAAAAAAGISFAWASWGYGEKPSFGSVLRSFSGVLSL